MACLCGSKSAAYKPLIDKGPALSRDDVLRWFVKDATEEDVDFVFGNLKLQAPDRAQELGVPHKKVTLTRHNTRSQRSTGEETNSLATIVVECSLPEEQLLEKVGPSSHDFTHVCEEKTVVQFSVQTSYVTEDDEVTVIPVLRMGHLEESSSVRYCTKAVSAIPGVHFEEVEGTLTFKPGASSAEIAVKIFNNHHWNNTVEFQVQLLPDSCEGCVVGQFLWLTRVKVIDESTFPSDRYKNKQGGELSQFELFVDYVKLCVSDSVVWYGSLRLILVDLLHILFHGVTLLTNAYIVDGILKNEEMQDTPEIAKSYLVASALLITLPEGVVHFLDYRKPTWKVAGTARRFLQNALFRKFLDYDDASRAQVEPGSTIMAITRDVDTVVDHGYLSTLALCKALCNVLSMLIFKLFANRLFGTPLSPAILVAFFALPVLIIPVAALRQHVAARYLAEQVRTQDACADLVGSSVEQFRLLRDFQQRAATAEAFDRSVVAYNKAVIETTQVTTNSQYFVTWIGKMVTGLYIVFRGVQVVQGTCRLGIYMVDIQIFMAMIVSYGQVFTVLMSIGSIKPALQRITLLINMSTNLFGQQSRTRSSVRMSRGHENPDELQLVLFNPRYCFDMGQSSIARTDIKLDGKVSFPQGQLVAVAGPPGQGKSTLLQLLAGVIVTGDMDGPTPPVFVPSHLRALHVMTHPIFFFGTLLENLTYGTQRQRTARAADSEASTKRVKAICQKLGVEQRAMDMLDSSEKLKWPEVFSHSQLALLGLARALIYDPELLCIHKPVASLNDEEKTRVLEVLKEFVAERGLESQSGKTVRRPRTCIFTTTGQSGLAVADQIIYVKDGRLRLMDNATLQALGPGPEGCPSTRSIGSAPP